MLSSLALPWSCNRRGKPIKEEKGISFLKEVRLASFPVLVLQAVIVNEWTGLELEVGTL